MLGEELIEAIDSIKRDGESRVLVLEGSGGAFCSGGDINWFSSVLEAKKRGAKDVDDPADWAVRIVQTCMRVSIPMIAAIHGVATGGGATLPLCFDIRIASEDARISFPFTSAVAIVPECGSTYFLSRIVGIAKACELVFTGKTISGKEAKEIGLVNDAVPAGKLKETVHDLAKTIAKGAPLSMRLSKRGLYQGMNADALTQLLWEESALNETFASEDHAEAINSFLEKRQPVFKGS